MVLAGVAFYAAEKFEQRDLMREQALAESALRAELSELSALVKDHSWWDIALQNLVVSPDPEWADDNIGSYLRDDFEFGLAVVIGEDGARGITFLDGEDRTANDLPEFDSALLLGLHQSANEAGMDQPQPVAGFARGAAGIYALAAAALTPENPTPEQLERRIRPTLIYGRSLSGPFRVEVSEHYLLAEGRAVFEFPSEPDLQALASVPIKGLSGETVGHVVWRHDSGAGQFRDGLTTIVLFAIAGLLILGGLFGLALWRSRGLAHATSAALSEERRLLDERTHLLTTIAHDLKTPLTAIQSAVDLLLHFSDRMDAAERRTELQVVQDRVVIMDRIITDALAIGRDETHIFNPESVDVAEAVRELWRQQLPDAERALELTDVRPERGLSPVDRRLFDQAVGNLLSNALKYGAEATPVRVRLSSEGRFLMLSVVNRGRGVPAGEMEKVTEAFFRASNAGTISGTGLGLSIAARAVRQHGGFLTLSGVEGEGMTATATFDLSPGSGASEGAASE